MPNQRAADQTLIASALSGELLRGLDRTRGDKNRSDFIRAAIAAELRRKGIHVPDQAVRAPDRVRKMRYPQASPDPTVVGGSSSELAAEALTHPGKLPARG